MPEKNGFMHQFLLSVGSMLPYGVLMLLHSWGYAYVKMDGALCLCPEAVVCEWITLLGSESNWQPSTHISAYFSCFFLVVM